MTPLEGIDFDQYRTQAKELLKLARAADPQALDRIRSHHPEHDFVFSQTEIKLADAQLVVARELGFGSWPKLKDYLIFRMALAALDSGDIEKMTTVVSENPAVLTFRCRIGTWYEDGYFKGATLLNHVAGNPIRCPLPVNIVDVTRTLLAMGADSDIATESGATTIGLLLTGKQVSDAGVGVTLIEILKAAGAEDDLEDADVLSAPLWNGGRATAEELVRRGTKMDIRHAAALGRVDELESMLKSDADPSRLEAALIYASQQGEVEAARLLIRYGAKGDVFIRPGSALTSFAANATALHTAAWLGRAEIVSMLLENGADASVIEPTYQGAPADWAAHGGHDDIAEILRSSKPK